MRLVSEGQINERLEPKTVLEVLVSHHTLIRTGAGEGGVSFQHQQFEEWYASFEVERAMRASAAGDDAARRHLRVDILNQPAWEESILFACERVSRDGGGADIVGEAVLLALAIDPMLAAEMIYRSDAAVWDRVRKDVLAFANRWHRAGAADRAARFMVMTGRPEFAPTIWPLATSEDFKYSCRCCGTRHDSGHPYWGPISKIGSGACRKTFARTSYLLWCSKAGSTESTWHPASQKQIPAPMSNLPLSKHCCFGARSGTRPSY